MKTEARMPCSTKGMGKPLRAERPAGKHHAHKGRGHHPACTAAELHRPEPHRDHREQMIHAEHGVDEAAREARAVVAGVSLSQSRSEREGDRQGNFLKHRLGHCHRSVFEMRTFRLRNAWGRPAFLEIVCSSRPWFTSCPTGSNG